MSEKKIEEKKSFGDSPFGAIFAVIGVILIAGVSYIGWVNSGMNDGNFFGMAFQLPLESRDHYCWRKSNIIIVHDNSVYRNCMAEE